MTNGSELESAVAQFDAAMKKLDGLIVELREVVGTIGLLVLTIKRLLKKP